MTITCAEIFAGAGLIGGGFKYAGFQMVFAAELDPKAVATYNKNLDPIAEIWDVTMVKPGLKYDVLVAGPPCQGFSSLGRRNPKDARSSLSICVFEWAKAHNPNVVVVENVPQFLNSDYCAKLKVLFSDRGYEWLSWTLNAEDFGVAQRRMRSFTIFSRIGLPKKPVAVKNRQTIRQAFKGLDTIADGENFHTAPLPSQLALSRIKQIPEGGDKRDVMKSAPDLCPPSWFKMGNQAVDVWGRMDWDKPANTLKCSFQSASKGRYLHPVEDRVISLREGARIQGIPDSWTFCGDRTSIARQIGNGVPVPLANVIASSIMDLFHRK